ncbi:MAG: hypothetical protein ABIS86_04745 [Streptosporangiaceae bacterium]
MGSIATAAVPATADSGPGSRRRWAWLLAVGWLLQVGLRLWLAARQNLPTANPDETGYLFAARILAGGPDADMSTTTFYQIGYPLLISPAFWFSGDAETIFRLVVGINSVLSALIVPLGFLAGRRFGLSPVQAFVLAQVTALLPASIFFAQYALTDAVLPVVVLAWLLAVHSWLGGSFWAGPAAGLLAGFAYATHSRGLIIVGVQALLLLAALIRRWAPRKASAASAATLAVTLAAGYLGNAWLKGHLYKGGIKQLGHWLTERLTTLDGLGWTLAGGLGQIWYLIVSTWGLAGLALVAAVVILRRPGVPLATRLTGAAVLLTVLGIAFVTIAALPDENRVGNLVYGRYLACLAPALFVAGGALILRAGRGAVLRLAAVAAAVTLLIALVVRLHAGTRLTRSQFVPFDFPETSFLTWDWHVLDLWLATGAALALLAVAVLTRPVIAAVVLALAGLGASVTATQKISHVMVADMAPAVLPVASPDRVAIDQALLWRLRLPQTFQVTWSQVLTFDAAKAPVPAGATVVIMPWPDGTRKAASWPTAPEGWKPVASARTYLGGNWVAWRPAG